MRTKNRPAARNQPLADYWRKRDFDNTPEPRGKPVKPGKALRFFIQKHAARRLHYDFRLELGGTLKSWAVPKGPSLDPGDKRLAVHVEDHPLDYGDFEGVIPEHHYGAGSVLVWDKGVWLPEGDPAQGLRQGHLKFELRGVKLTGRWALVRMGTPKEDKENWLLIKERDDAAKTGEAAAVTELQPDSVLGAAAKKPPVRARGKTEKSALKKKTAAAQSVDAVIGARKAALPDKIKPQLATLIDRAPSGEAWLSEIKFDGYRALCKITRGEACLYSRGGNDRTRKWRAIGAAAAGLPVEQAWLDGEVVAIDDDGAVSFQLLQNIERDQVRGRLAYYVFDLLYLNGYDLRGAPLAQRKRLLKSVLAEAGDPIFFSDHLDGDAAEFFKNACAQGLEGIIVKRGDAPYQSARSRDWLKVKCIKRQEFVIGGYTDPAGRREGFGALLIGVHDDAGQLRYAGRVGTGFDDATLRALAEKFKKIATKAPPFINPPTGAEAAGVHWLKPKLIAEVKFAQWTAAGVVRHAAFVGLRSDKRSRDIRREEPLPIAELAAGKKKAKAAARKHDDMPDEPHIGDERSATAAGITLTHADRVLFPAMGLTKLELAQYYEEVEAWILPHVTRRPLTLVRCPDGVDGQCFYQKHVNRTTVKGIATVEVPSGDGTATYMTVKSLSDLAGLVQMGVLELHTWGAHAGRLDKPDRLIFDLDPAPDLPWREVITAAQLVRGLLEEIGLISFVKTTGGKGLHVVVPLKPERGWDEVKGFSRAVAHHLAQTLPDRYTAKMSKRTRTGKIFIDYLRNAAEATAVAAYSTRAKPGAPVSTPIAWDELSEDLRSDSFNVANLRERLRRLQRDPWADYFSSRQRLTAKMLRLFAIE